MDTLYLLYSCNEWCEKSKALLLLVTSDKDTLHTAVGGEILVGNMDYRGENGGKGFAAYKEDYIAGKDVLRELKYGFINEIDNALLNEPDTVPKYYMDAHDFLAPDFRFDPDAFDRACSGDEMERGDEHDEEYDDEI